MVSYLRTLLSGGVKGAPHNAPFGPFHTSFHKLLIDGLFHKDSRPCGAALALVEEHTLVSLLHRVVHYKRKHLYSQHSLACGLSGETPSFPLSKGPGIVPCSSQPMPTSSSGLRIQTTLAMWTWITLSLSCFCKEKDKPSSLITGDLNFTTQKTQSNCDSSRWLRNAMETNRSHHSWLLAYMNVSPELTKPFQF